MTGDVDKIAFDLTVTWCFFSFLLIPLRQFVICQIKDNKIQQFQVVWTIAELVSALPLIGWMYGFWRVLMGHILSSAIRIIREISDCAHNIGLAVSQTVPRQLSSIPSLATLISNSASTSTSTSTSSSTEAQHPSPSLLQQGAPTQSVGSDFEALEMRIGTKKRIRRKEERS